VSEEKVNEAGWKVGDAVKTKTRIPGTFSYGFVKKTSVRSCRVRYAAHELVVANQFLLHLDNGEIMPEAVERVRHAAPAEPPKATKEENKAAKVTKEKKEKAPREPKAPKEKVTLHPDVEAAKVIYDEALVRLDAAIKASQAASAALKVEGAGDVEKELKASAKAEHAAALEHIKTVRARFHELRDKHHPKAVKESA
jgi:hypothetical protein